MNERSRRTVHRRRLRRINVPGTARYLTYSCFQNRPLLRASRTCAWLANAINGAREKYGFRVWAYVFMPTHVHLLLRPDDNSPDVGPILGSTKLSVARRAIRWVKVNAPHSLGPFVDRSPSGKVTHRFWQRGAGYDRSLITPAHIWEAIDYIHYNPVAEGLCDFPHVWYWSSAAFHRDGTPGPVALDLTELPARH